MVRWMRSSINYGGWPIFSSNGATFGRCQTSIHISIQHPIPHGRNKSRIRSKRLRIRRNDLSIWMQKCIVPKVHQRQYDWQVVTRICVYKVMIDIVRSNKERWCNVPSKYEWERLCNSVSCERSVWFVWNGNLWGHCFCSHKCLSHTTMYMDLLADQLQKMCWMPHISSAWKEKSIRFWFLQQFIPYH